MRIVQIIVLVALAVAVALCKDEPKEKTGDDSKGEVATTDGADVAKLGQQALDKHKDAALGYKMMLSMIFRKYLPAFMQRFIGIYKPNDAKKEDGDADYHKKKVNYMGSIAKQLTDSKRTDQAKAYWQEALNHKKFADELSGATKDKTEKKPTGKKNGVIHHTELAEKLEAEIKELKAKGDGDAESQKKIEGLQERADYHKDHAKEFKIKEDALEKKLKDENLEEGSDGFKKAHGEHHKALAEYFRKHFEEKKSESSEKAANYHDMRAKGFLEGSKEGPKDVTDDKKDEIVKSEGSPAK